MPVVAAALALASSALVVSRVAAARRDGLAVTWHRVPWARARRVRVAQLTDLHLGPTTPRSIIDRAVEIVHGAEPDLVVLTGDYVNASLYFIDRITALARALPKPCVAVLGNHDHWTDPVRIGRALERGGAEVLRNASTRVVAHGERLDVVGVDDGCSRNADVTRSFKDVVEPRRALVLSHFPSTALEIAATGAPLVLSGHTHAGHVDVPHATTAVARLAGNPFLHGFYRVGDGTDLYVSAGLGHSLPGLRGGRARPEIAVFDLDPEARERRSRTTGAPFRA